jgi:multicomponent Na+:H+ antiporter subunit B
MISLYSEIFTLTLILILGVYCISSEKLIVSVLSLSLISLFSAFFYLLIGAPDVALTEASVGAAVSTCIILAALEKYGYIPDKNVSAHTKLVPFFFCITLFIILCYFVIELPLYGDIYSTANQGVALEYKQHILDDTKVGSLVTGILASYRGFDTLGETFVILTSGIAVTAILKGTNE